MHKIKSASLFSFYILCLYLLHFQPHLLFINNEEIIKWGGTAIIAIMVYAETATLMGLVIPGGETLLFTAGLLAGTEALSISLVPLILILIVVAVIGDLTGYKVGEKLGKKLYKKEDTWYYKKKYLKRAEEYYYEKGKWALVFGRFLPVIRTFNPAFSGSIKLPMSQFLPFIVLGAIGFTVAVVCAGYYLGRQFPWLRDYLGWILLGIVILVLIPVFRKIFREKGKADKE
ncbi:MAG: DedA family protein [Candidatus Cyclobacteriaceae bacterium M2_1C_046]